MTAIPGLSPRVRGNRVSLPPVRAIVGSIPACAGEPSGRDFLSGEDRVYPRVCGGTDAGLEDKASVQGLSPRVRGNLAARA